MKPSFHIHALWLYGVLVGLTLEQALTGVVPHLLDAPAGDPWHGLLEAHRLFALVLLATRFYLGSVVYYDWAYFGTVKPEPKGENPRIDFLSGLFHFLILFASSVALKVGAESEAQHAGLHNTPFLVLLITVLAYDVLWWIVNCRSVTAKKIRMWAVVNAATLVLGLVAFLVMKFAYPGTAYAEHAALGILNLVSLVDLSDMIRGESIIARAFRALGDDGGPVAASQGNADREVPNEVPNPH